MTLVVVLAVGLFVAAYQSYVSWRVWTSDMYSTGQKSAQLAIIWLLPILGAGIVHWVHYGQARTSEAPSGKYLEEQRYEDHDTNPRIFND
jgi:hypothetical protein